MPRLDAKPLDFATAAAMFADAVERDEGPMTANKRKVVEAAVVTFAERGFEATSTKEIAKRAGVAEATIFRHFATKQDLLLRLVKPLANHVLVPIAVEEIEAAARAGGAFDVTVRTLLHSRLQFARRFVPIIRIMIQEAPFQPELRVILMGAFTSLAASVMKLIGGAMAAGAIRPVHPPRAIRWIASLLVGYFAASTLMLPDLDWDDEAEIEAMVGFILNGLKRA